MKMRLPRHIGFIPDGNRRWAESHGLPKEAGYQFGIEPGLQLCRLCQHQGVEEISVYGFTQDNTRRPSVQKKAFQEACVDFAQGLSEQEVALLVVGDDRSEQFPQKLRWYRSRRGRGMKVNLLINYGWEWDMAGLREHGGLQSEEVSRIDLIVRWGGGSRLSGFLPVQSVYADICILKPYWPDFQPQHLTEALEWFRHQDRTLGG